MYIIMVLLHGYCQIPPTSHGIWELKLPFQGLTQASWTHKFNLLNWIIEENMFQDSNWSYLLSITHD